MRRVVRVFSATKRAEVQRDAGMWCNRRWGHSQGQPQWRRKAAMAGLPSVRGNEREDVDGAGVSRVGGVEVGTEAGANQDASSCVSDIFC